MTKEYESLEIPLSTTNWEMHFIKKMLDVKTLSSCSMVFKGPSYRLEKKSNLSLPTQMQEEELQTSVVCFCYCFLAAYLALAGLMNFLAQLSDRIHHFTVYNLMPLAFLAKLFNMHRV